MQKQVSLKEVMTLAPDDPLRVRATKILTKLQAVARGYKWRQNFKSIKFLHLASGLPVDKITNDDIQKVP